MFDMALWLAMRDAIALVTPREDLIMDGIPAPEGTFNDVAPAAVVSAMISADGVLIASSTIPTGLPTKFTVKTTAGADWLLCDLSTRKSVAAKLGAATWSAAAETGSVLLFGSKTPCHAGDM
jgi:hypothetical protein